MKKRKEPFTDPAQLGKLNEEVWKTLDESHEIAGKAPPDGDDTQAPAPNAVAGDAPANPPPRA
ncbi:MAG: hypothetical protein KJ614_17695 [Gammaproteobacteria bacterium]|uniref:hypothetical protein n=1 Tax=Rhodoferax sp. TaxID=50421 RepID=UPI00180559E3|nr:hypothetical protein [Rhodoferax sp.]MBU3900722.1 hypothetical protein [Gammaproteobacteria bacterium]MBA3056733.1 hypothetical protein [Rhodoferax sp.]MBU3997200.1 hypothetical protein [Gammaproteobacteria bacterium]MBU4079473.1 hypothetical protein [Gammaproteobacteria bacterium]MBU4114819.1 hypothetical protein [Gammaproteobacteria bacterium]